MNSAPGRRTCVLAAALVACALALAGCAPALDWRQVAVDAGALTAMFPCRPEHRARTVPLGADSVRMEMVACTAGASTYAVSYVDIRDPAAVTGALETLRIVAATNVGGAAPHVESYTLRGMTPNAAAARLRVEGRLPDGKAVREHATFFVRGLRVYQATVIGAMPAPNAVETFLDGLKLAP